METPSPSIRGPDGPGDSAISADRRIKPPADATHSAAKSAEHGKKAGKKRWREPEDEF